MTNSIISHLSNTPPPNLWICKIPTPNWGNPNPVYIIPLGRDVLGPRYSNTPLTQRLHILYPTLPKRLTPKNRRPSVILQRRGDYLGSTGGAFINQEVQG
eukprot:CAMPEP_0171306546 /NCGR_PEP_ID=MMETSP0816-20121228/16571_1 /TAXON_ID=420281 /ORGANISM="Proboscia inermis, Strain CCAP1064/1" /LENGTH=99 /DNA_ID=CAMNT_0011788193 /DNA_START=105 /DNA_END=405 /DNA_ORIENTATION=+